MITSFGAAEVRSDGADPTRPPDLEALGRLDTLEDRGAGGGRALRLFGGAAVIAGGAAACLFSTDEDEPWAYATSGAAGAFALIGATMLVLSRRF